MSTTRDDLCEWVIRISGEMLELAHAGDWETFDARQTERDRLIRAALPEPLTAPPPAPLSERLQTILDLDRRLIAAGRERRDQLQQQRLELQRARKSARLYEA